MKSKDDKLPVKQNEAGISTQERQFFADIAELLQTARNTAYRAVNTIMVQTYWNIGKRIVEQEQQGKDRAQYGDFLIVNLSRYLSDTFGKGFSEPNLRNIRQFYLTFPEFATHCVTNLTWTNIRLIMRLPNAQERDWYLKEAATENWSSRTLERNIKSGYYRRLLSSKGSISLPETVPLTAEFIKDPYVLEFLDVPEDLNGKETLLESTLISNMQKLLLELGKGFCFVARQMHISTETSHFFIDLIFYNYLLKCFVIIDLKTRKLTHGDIGQMDMYVRMFDQLKRGNDDNPTLGMILCTDKDETIVKYSVLQENRHLFVSEYQTVLPTEEELASMLEYQTKRLIEESKDWENS